MSSEALTIYWDNGGADDQFLTAANWGESDTLPDGDDIAGININSTLSHSSGNAVPNALHIQNTNGTATMNFDGGTITTGNVNVGHNDTSAATDGRGILNVSAGTFTANNVNVGANNYAIGVLNISGGTFSVNNIIVDQNADTQGFINISGTPTISGNNLTLNENADLSFALTATGVADITLAGTFDVNTGADLSVDASAYTGGSGTYELIQFGTLGDSMWASSAVTGLSGGLTGSIVFDSDSMNLVIIPEPTTSALLGLVSLGLIVRRRR